jgi:hypothetical protein
MGPPWRAEFFTIRAPCPDTDSDDRERAGPGAGGKNDNRKESETTRMEEPFKLDREDRARNL